MARIAGVNIPTNKRVVIELTYIHGIGNTKAKEIMLERTHIAEAPWWVVQADDKKKARLNCINHLLGQMPYEEVELPQIELPQRVREEDYSRSPTPPELMVPQVY